MARLSFISIATVLIVGMASSVQASIVDLTFSGTYEGDAGGPFSYSMTYDTSLDTNTEFVPTGTDLDGYTTTHEWYGYSASGITDLDFQFDELEFLLSDLNGDRSIAEGTSADLWFDVDLAAGATSTLAWFSFGYTADDSLGVGTGTWSSSPGNVYLRSVSAITQSFGEYLSAHGVTITRSDPDPIPEPASVITAAEIYQMPVLAMMAQ